jgi:serine/threonine protein kinase
MAGRSRAAHVNPTPGAIIANRFQLVRELGRGTMGTVWLAQHLTLDVGCAVKFMTAEAAREPMYTARFALEARAIAQIQSPNIVRVLDYDLWNGVPFIAMERLVGEDLGARLHRVHKLDVATTRRIVGQVARGLARAHAAGIVHRDLKPENIFLAREDDEEVAKLVDFGIAKFEGRAGRRTQVGEILGTPAYMSPEQTRCAQTIDSRADLWSLGAIAFECLTGRLAFDGTSLGEIFARILVEPMPVPSQLAPELPPAFDAWFARAVCREPDCRFADARAMSDALERALDEGPRRARLELVTARTLRPTPPRRRSGWPFAALGLAVSVVAVVAMGPRINRVPPLVTQIPPLVAPVVAPDVTSRWAPSSASAPALASAPAQIPPLVTPDMTSRSAPSSALASASASAPASAPAPALASAPASGSAETRPKLAPRRRASASRAVRAAAEAQRGSECNEGQRRCSGSVLQLCNAALDGWVDFIDCGENALCDATASGSGGCTALPINLDPAAR